MSGQRVFTLAKGVDDQGEVDEGDGHQIGFVEAREDAMNWHCRSSSGGERAQGRALRHRSDIFLT
ncbi:hypothetical protein [Burkholderia anthina]|uniref:Uncharacterized protein n=1 Tax=Burkholderia anthina TaxID=179879 RepID=A0A6P2G5I4_9BURK|nr:hypothetical protein [Burkholderia anthina]MBM2769242.1 hypothetical protein [Burkholderia anthina]VVU48913.1 hypothetical protein BAN20980_01612 [Burkholderia anthina]